MIPASLLLFFIFLSSLLCLICFPKCNQPGRSYTWFLFLFFWCCWLPSYSLFIGKTKTQSVIHYPVLFLRHATEGRPLFIALPASLVSDKLYSSTLLQDGARREEEEVYRLLFNLLFTEKNEEEVEENLH